MMSILQAAAPIAKALRLEVQTLPQVPSFTLFFTAWLHWPLGPTAASLS